MVSIAQLRAAATEFNEVMGLDPPINTRTSDVEELMKKIKEAIKYIDPVQDVFSEDTALVIEEMSRKSRVTEEEEAPSRVVKKPTPPKKKPEPKSEKTKEEPTPPEKEAPVKKHIHSLSSFLDDLIIEGGSWEKLLSKLENECIRRKLKTRPTRATVRAHMKYRTSLRPNYFGKLRATEYGIE